MDLLGLHLVTSVVIFISMHSITGVLSDEVLLSCSFETPCGLRHSSQSQYNWLPNNGQTQTRNTGPPNDHTLQTSSGRYIYAPSSVGRNDRGKKSTLYTPEYLLSSGSGRLEFYYHMWDGYGGDEMGTLNVYVCGSNTPAWSRSGNQGNQWKWTGQVDFSCQTTFRVYIEAVRGRYQSDIAIDDVTITDIFVPTTLPPTTKIITTPLKTTRMIPTTEKIPTTAELLTPRLHTLPTATETGPPPAETPVQITVQTTETADEPATPAPQLTVTSGLVIPTVLVTTPLKIVTKNSPVQSRPAGATEATSTSSEVTKDNVLNNKSSGESDSSFIGPIVVASVGFLFIGLTLCLAVTRKRSCRPSKSSSSGKDHSVATENRQYGTATTTDMKLDSTDPKKITDGYSYQELLQQSYSSIEGSGMASHQSGANAYQDITGNPPGREADLYAAIPEIKDGANEYSYVINPDRKAGHLGGAPSAGSSGWSDGNADQDYEAVAMTNVPNGGLVDNQFYVPFKE